MNSLFTPSTFSSQQSSKLNKYYSFQYTLTYFSPDLHTDNNNFYMYGSSTPAITKFDTDLNVIYSKKITTPTTQNPILSSLKVNTDSSSNIYLTTGTTLDSPNCRHFLKINSSGNIVWQKAFSASLISNFSRVVLDSQDNIYIGAYDSTSNTRIFKFDTSGNKIWEKKITPSSGRTNETNFCIGDNDSIYICGTDGSVATNGYICKIDSSGNPVWHRYTTSGLPYLKNVSYINGSIYVSSINGEIFKFDTNGNLLLSKKINIDSSNSGYTEFISFDNETIDIILRRPDTVTTEYTSYLIKLDANFNILKQKRSRVLNTTTPSEGLSLIKIGNKKYILESQSSFGTVIYQINENLSSNFEKNNLIYNKSNLSYDGILYPKLQDV